MSWVAKTFCTLATAELSVAAITIDNFSTGALKLDSSGSVSQEGLDHGSVLGGSRTVAASVLRPGTMDLQIHTTEGAFSFTSSNFGYFSITWMIDPAQRVDLMAGGQSAFLLTFSYVDPRFWRGGLDLSVDGVRRSISREWFALDGPGVIEVPFSDFTSGSSFIPGQIVFSADRFEPNLRLELSSITTIPEPDALFLLGAGTLLTVIRRRNPRPRLHTQGAGSTAGCSNMRIPS